MAIYGDDLHEKLSDAFRTNPNGKPYHSCVTEHEAAFWVDGANIAKSKIKDAYKVLIGQAVKVRCVCIDNQLIQTNIPKCDEVLFSDTKLVYVEAKIRVSSGSTNILKEIKDAIKNKIPRTHDIINSRMDGEFSVRHIEILIAMRQQTVIRINRQQEQQLLNEAKKHVGAFIKHVLLQEVIEF